jgi:lipoprotein
MKSSTIINIGLGLLAIMMFGCRKLDPAEVLKQKEQQISEQTRSWQNAIDSVLALGGELPHQALREFSPNEQIHDILVGGQKVIEHKAAGSPDVISAGYYRKVRRSFDLSGYELNNKYTSNLNGAVVWPGNLIYANSVKTNSLSGISGLNTYRKPGRITMALLNGNTELTRELSDYRYSEVNKQLNDLVASVKGEIPAQITYSVHSVRSLGEAAYYLGISKEEIEKDDRYREFRDVRWSSNTFKAVISFSQDFFTIVYDDPEDGPYGLFTSDLTPELLGRYTSRGNPLGYISSVTYGRRFYAIIEETRRTYQEGEQLKKGVEALLTQTPAVKSSEKNKTGDRGTPAVSSPSKSELRNIKIHLKLAGGKDIFSTNVSTIPTMKELQDFITASSKEVQTKYGLPVACTIKYLHGLKPLSVPRVIQGKYEFIDYIPEQDDNQITISGLWLKGTAAGDYTRGGDYKNISNHSGIYLRELYISYSLDGSSESHIDLGAPYKGRELSYKNGLNIRFPNQKLPAFGSTPNGHIRILMHLDYHIHLWGGGRDNFKYSVIREVMLRYNKDQGHWYISHDDYIDPQDLDFHRFGRWVSLRGCPIEVMLHYRVATRLKGPIE